MDMQVFIPLINELLKVSPVLSGILLCALFYYFTVGKQFKRVGEMDERCSALHKKIDGKLEQIDIRLEQIPEIASSIKIIESRQGDIIGKIAVFEKQMLDDRRYYEDKISEVVKMFFAKKE